MRTRKWYQSGLPVARLTCYTGAEEAAALDAFLAAGDSAAAAGATGATIGAGSAGLGAATAPAWLSSINPVALGLQGGGALVKLGAEQDAADRRSRLSNAMSAYGKQNADKQTNAVNQYATTVTPEARAGDLQTATNDAKLGLEQSVGAAQAFAPSGEVAGKVSQQFKDAGQASADASMARTNKLIANLATMRGQGLAQQQRARDFGQAAGNVSALKSDAGYVGNAYQSDIGGVQANPWAGVAGDALSGVGAGLAQQSSNKKLTDALAALRR